MASDAGTISNATDPELHSFSSASGLFPLPDTLLLPQRVELFLLCLDLNPREHTAAQPRMRPGQARTHKPHHEMLPTSLCGPASSPDPGSRYQWGPGCPTQMQQPLNQRSSVQRQGLSPQKGSQRTLCTSLFFYGRKDQRTNQLCYPDTLSVSPAELFLLNRNSGERERDTSLRDVAIFKNIL